MGLPIHGRYDFVEFVSVYWVLTVSLKSKRDSLANPLFGSSNQLHRAISSSGITTLSETHFNSIIITLIGIVLSWIALPTSVCLGKAQVEG